MSKFSIILPVKNGSNHIKECLESILSQSVQSFELIILENCSTDNTVEIIKSFRDERIRLISVTAPLSIEQNWQRSISVQKAEFMTLIGHDDVLDKDYLSTMNELIDKHPEASLYQAHFRFIDSQGNLIGKCKPMKEVQEPAEAVHNFLCNKIDLMGTGFMMRSRDYDDIGGIPAYPNLLFADMELWIELSRKKYLAVSPKEIFSYRKHLNATTSSSSDAIFLKSFEQLVNYFSLLRDRDAGLRGVIERDSTELLRQYCQGLTHRLLRKPKKERPMMSVSGVIDRFREYGKKLGSEGFDPLAYRSIRTGKIIDDNLFLHRLFLLFKKIYRAPVLKK